MTNEPSSLSQRAEAKARPAKRIDRQATCFDLVASGFSRRQIATALGVSLATVRPEVDKALAERPHARERFARLQVARLTKALSHVDLKIEHGNIWAFAPYMNLVSTLDQYHGFDGRLGGPGAAQPKSRLPRRRLSPSGTPPSLPSRRSRQELRDSAPKTLKSFARLSTLRVARALKLRSPTGSTLDPVHRRRPKLMSWEFPRLCRGGSSSLTFPTVAAERG